MLFRAGGERVPRGHYCRDEIRGGHIPVRLQQGNQAVLAPLLVVWVHEFRHAVGVAEEEIAAADIDGPFAEQSDVHQTDHGPSRLQPLHPAVAAAHDACPRSGGPKRNFRSE